MAASNQDKVLVACPHCGQAQAESRTAFSTVCKKCGRNFRVQEALNPTRKESHAAPEQRKITCFECGADLDVPVSAQSTMCKRCSRYVDLKDYHIANGVSKNFKTKGSFTVEPTGYVFNTEVIARDAVLKGRFLGKITTEHSLTIYSTAEIKGSFNATHLIIPAANRFAWKVPLKVNSAEIAGELVASLHASGTIILKSTARFFGDIETKSLIIEEGAVLVGNLKIGTPTKT